MSQLKGNAVVGQSGGPTAAINASLAGVIRGVLANPDAIPALYGMKNGIEGFLAGDCVSLLPLLSDETKLRHLEQTPAAVLGSCRKKLPDPAKDRAFFDGLIEKFRETQREDIQNGFTSTGPHRDDIDFQINKKSARSFGSQGQQRSIVLALKFAEAEMLAASIGEKPVLLLDDVMSELDQKRQEYILNHIGGYQVLITCCDVQNTELLEKGAVFTVSDGRIARNP